MAVAVDEGDVDARQPQVARRIADQCRDAATPLRGGQRTRIGAGRLGAGGGRDGRSDRGRGQAGVDVRAFHV
ncbi:hypothetical protein, partial [Sphingomonas adhaesiva]|uniref:hypothetical protein n=1 Tax=Sphingomonas adhaesiva TaxID=28212 RepID=UPI0012ED5427